MRGLELQIEWREPAPDDDAFGPEEWTWGALTIRLDGSVLTLNHPADRESDVHREHVIGGMSGLAEWLVENWPYVLWETHPPFPRAPVFPGARGSRTPSLRDASVGWRDVDPDVPRVRVAQWQHRHSFGHGSSPMAVPSIVFLPDERAIGIMVDDVPVQLDPTVRFTPALGPDEWPTNPAWVGREDLELSFARFISSVLERARGRRESRRWARWLDDQWQEARRRADDKEHRRELMFGEVVASRWPKLEEELGDRLPALEGLLADSSPPTGDAEVDFLRDLAQQEPPRAAESQGRSGLSGVDRSLPPFLTGYQMASRLREALDLRDNPIVELSGMLHDKLGISVGPIESHGMFRSAVVASTSGGRIWYAKDNPRFIGLPPVRFAVAAALGRLVASSSPRSFGAAHGSQSRVRETQTANAFAAELLLPGRVAAACLDIAAVAQEYGISRTAAEWQRANSLDRH
jgi:hypothetical protein